MYIQTDILKLSSRLVSFMQAELSMAQAQRQTSGASEMMSGWRQRAAQAQLEALLLRRGHLTATSVPWMRHAWGVWAAHATGARSGRGGGGGRGRRGRGRSESRSESAWMDREVASMDFTVALRREVPRPPCLAPGMR